jgi:uncharacterized protein YoaH (UPF0181 family)
MTKEQQQAVDMVRALMPHLSSDEEAIDLLKKITFSTEAILERKKLAKLNRV